MKRPSLNSLAGYSLLLWFGIGWVSMNLIYLTDTRGAPPWRFFGQEVSAPIAFVLMFLFEILGIALLLLPLIAAGRLLARLIRRVIEKLLPQPKSGLCPACGYDLRATPNQCPECGKTFQTPSNSRPPLPEFLRRSDKRA